VRLPPQRPNSEKTKTRHSHKSLNRQRSKLTEARIDFLINPPLPARDQYQERAATSCNFV
jgi:hypothetical protein